MASNSPVGAANRVVCWSISGAAADAVVMTFNKNVTEAITGAVEKGFATLDLDSKILNKELSDMFETYLVDAEVAPQSIVYDDASKDTFTPIPSNVQRLLFLFVGGALSGQRMFHAFTGMLSGDTGNMSFTANSLADTPIQFQALPASAEYTIGSDKIWASYSDLTDLSTYKLDLTIAIDAIGQRVFIDQTTGIEAV